MYSLVSLISGIYPFLEMPPLLVTKIGTFKIEILHILIVHRVLRKINSRKSGREVTHITNISLKNASRRKSSIIELLGKFQSFEN